jgi:Protein of unknown function (DUF3619)
MNTRELNFAYKVRHALNENLDSLPAPAVERLAAARRQALTRKKQERGTRLLAWRIATAGAGNGATGSHPWLAAAGAVLPALVLAAGLAGIFQFVEQRRIADTAEIDAEMLADELPLSAYLDNGFQAFLSKRSD